MQVHEKILILITLFGTLFIGIINFIMSISISKRSRYADIAVKRRKKRIDKFIIYYSKIFALTHPNTIETFTGVKKHLYFEKLYKNFSKINMLFDHRFKIDKYFTFLLKRLVDKAAEYFAVLKSSEFKHDLSLKYRELFLTSTTKTDKLLNIYIGTEWSRLKEEAARGKPVELPKWKKYYKISQKYFEKWDNYDLNKVFMNT